MLCACACNSGSVMPSIRAYTDIVAKKYSNSWLRLDIIMLLCRMETMVWQRTNPATRFDFQSILYFCALVATVGKHGQNSHSGSRANGWGYGQGHLKRGRLGCIVGSRLLPRRCCGLLPYIPNQFSRHTCRMAWRFKILCPCLWHRRILRTGSFGLLFGNRFAVF